MRLFLAITCCFLSSFCLCQSEWQQGYANGYKEGYCYGKFGCISPNPPPSLPTFNERNDSYQDGYNNGFKKGLKDAEKLNGGGQSSNGFESQTPNRELQRLYMLQQTRSELGKWEETERQKKLAYLEFVNKFYDSFNSYPEQIPDGWYKVVVTDNQNEVRESKVYVQQNKISTYFDDNWKKFTVSNSSEIKKAKSYVSIERIGKISNYEVIFINYLSTKVADQPPLNTGTVSFCLRSKKARKIDVFVDNIYVGSITNNIDQDENRPYCNDSRCLTFTFKEGTYNFEARTPITDFSAHRKFNWSGMIKVTKGECFVQGLSTK